MSYYCMSESKKETNFICIRCGNQMSELSACHLKCFVCGAEHDCSDKGNYW